RPVPANAKQYPLVDPKELAGAKRIASLTGPELESSIEGGQVVLRLPLPAIEPPPASTAPPAASATPAPAATPRPMATPIPGPVPPAAGGVLHVYAVKTVAKDGETSAFSNLAMLLPQPAPPAPTGLSV